ncbi:MAG: hypothetical protein M1833_001390 [Piccolia ochrophora]|nr:MAG: hypothetical protein M1833_001390 [Piccolia ochrophora]
MSSLDLKQDDPIPDGVSDKAFYLLRAFLQLDTASTLESTSQSILALLPEKDPNSTDVWCFGETCIEVAEQIPYHHPAQLKLVGLLEYLGESTKLGQTYTSKGAITSRYNRYQRLGESLKEAFTSPDPENPIEYVNFHAFAANIYERRILGTDATWAIWAQREAHEGLKNEQGSVRDAYVLAAAQWIIYYGQSFFKEVIRPREVSSTDLQYWKPGPLYAGKADLSLDRWHFWRDGFRAAASQEVDEKGLRLECKNVAAKAAALMDAFEDNMTF